MKFSSKQVGRGHTHCFGHIFELYWKLLEILYLSQCYLLRLIVQYAGAYRSLRKPIHKATCGGILEASRRCMYGAKGMSGAATRDCVWPTKYSMTMVAYRIGHRFVSIL